MKILRPSRAVALAATLLLAVGLVRGAAPSVPPAPASVLAPLETVQRALEQTASTLGTATVATHGIFLDRAQADLARASVAVKAALAHARANPSIGDQPATVPPGSR